jgi:hypothetical protein
MSLLGSNFATWGRVSGRRRTGDAEDGRADREDHGRIRQPAGLRVDRQLVWPLSRRGRRAGRAGDTASALRDLEPASVLRRPGARVSRSRCSQAASVLGKKARLRRPADEVERRITVPCTANRNRLGRGEPLPLRA